MNLYDYKFENCTLNDAAGQPHMLVPRDWFGIPCFPGDIVCEDTDPRCHNPFEVAGLWVYDAEDGVQAGVVDSLGNRYYADEVFHIIYDTESESGYAPVKQIFAFPFPNLIIRLQVLILSHN